MSNGCTGPIDDSNNGSREVTESREKLYEEVKNEKKDEHEDPEVDDEGNDDKTESDATSGGAVKKATSQSPNPFVVNIDRGAGRSEREENGAEKEPSVPSSSSTTSSSETPAPPGGMGFRPEFIAPGPNPIRIPPDDFINTLVGFNNMYLAHEICVNPEYKLERFSPPSESMEARIQEQMKRAFWDLLDEQLKADPPNYTQALSVFEELKQMLLGLLMPHNHSMRRRINDVLCLDLIRQQVQHDALDFPKYAAFILEILSQLCAPSRDEEIGALSQLSEPVEVLRGILEVMEKMKLDMANFYIQQFRPAIVQNCIQYETTKFGHFLDLEYRLEEDGLRNTRSWLLKHKGEGLDMQTVIRKAFCQVLQWGPEKEGWPETLALDCNRLIKLATRVKRLGIIGGVVLSAESLCQTMLGRPAPDLRKTLKDQLESLVTEEDVVKAEKLQDSLDGVAEQSVKLIGDVMQSQKGRGLEDAEKDAIRRSITDLVREDHPIRSLLVRRTIEFAETALSGAKSPTVPAGLTCIGPEVTVVIRDLYRIVQFNRAVFDAIYTIIIEDPIVDEGDWSVLEPNIKSILKAIAPKEEPASANLSSSPSSSS